MENNPRDGLCFFLQNNHIERLTIPIALHARERGYGLEDRSSHQDFDADQCGIDWSQYETVIPFGSVQFIRSLKRSSIGQFVMHDEAMFGTSVWSEIFGQDTLNADGFCIDAAQVPQLLAQRGRMHLRPDSVDKAFIGAVHDVESWTALLSNRRIDDDLVCFASPLKTIEHEWRCWIIDGQVVEISRYMTLGKLDTQSENTPELFEAAQVMANRYLPAPCVVMDMALCEGSYKLLEFNPIHCSGWYKADVSKVLDLWAQWTVENKHIFQSNISSHHGKLRK